MNTNSADPSTFPRKNPFAGYCPNNGWKRQAISAKAKRAIMLFYSKEWYAIRSLDEDRHWETNAKAKPIRCAVCGGLTWRNSPNDQTCSEECSAALRLRNGYIDKVLQKTISIEKAEMKRRSFKCKQCGSREPSPLKFPRCSSYCTPECRDKYAYKHWLKKADQKPQRILAHRFRNRVRKFLFGKDHKSARELLGCSMKFFQEWIQNRFKDGMAWNNRDRWHLDHVISVNSFDLSDPKQVKKCFHYTNFQPLWGPENLKKGAKIWRQVQLIYDKAQKSTMDIKDGGCRV